jgi:CRISPR-associated protein Cmr5
MSSPRQTLEQQRAAFVWERLKQYRGDKALGDYRNLAKGAPALVAGNGLLPTLLFYRGKSKRQHELLLGDIAAWLALRRLPSASGTSTPDALIEALVRSEPSQYRQATDEVMQLLRWVRQFASAVAEG